MKAEEMKVFEDEANGFQPLPPFILQPSAFHPSSFHLSVIEPDSATIQHTLKMGVWKTLVKEALDGLVTDLRATHGDNLASVVLYGSAAAGDQVELRSDYNLLIALNRITPEDLRQAQAPMREWRRLGHPLPVYFTVEELSDAADVFPIEFHQMGQMRALYSLAMTRLSSSSFLTLTCDTRPNTSFAVS